MEEKYVKLLKQADEWLEAHKTEFITELQEMVRIPSVSRADLAKPGAPFGPDCRKMLDYALAHGKACGFDTADHDGYAGSIYMGDPENALGIIAHMDVVPVGDGWVYPPFEGTYVPEQDAMIGRGVGDNKGPGVAGLFAMRMLRDFGWPLKHGIRLICGCSEETGMQDMKA
ncbi:MAG: M20/M25/M40 family metallo-hydrolase, partial [Clostridia bacterium]|nr:M20/M25/M40 family metallo-hydrolase [Clostridia bacterium]